MRDDDCLSNTSTVGVKRHEQDDISLYKTASLAIRST